MDRIPYRKFCVLRRTRPDIAAAVSMLGRVANDPVPNHWTAMKHVLRYQLATKDYGTIIKKGVQSARVTTQYDAY